MDSDGYDISAIADGDATNEQMYPMLQSLLRERFQLQIHRETRELPVYVLGENNCCIRVQPGVSPELPATSSARTPQAARLTLRERGLEPVATGPAAQRRPDLDGTLRRHPVRHNRPHDGR